MYSSDHCIYSENFKWRWESKVVPACERELLNIRPKKFKYFGTNELGVDISRRLMVRSIDIENL